MALPVDIVIKDTELVPQPISGVVVQVLDPVTSALIAQATSDVTGTAAFLLPGAPSPSPTPYEVRFFKLGVLFTNPQAIAVEEPLLPHDTNNFTASGVLTSVLQPAIDPRLCRCQGRFMNLSNQPIANNTVRIMAKAEQDTENPKYVDENVISAQEMAFKTDANGYLVVDLFRTGQFEIMYGGDDDTAKSFYVPDEPYAQWGDLIDPYPVSIAWDPTVAPGNVVSMHVGDCLSVPFTALFSNTVEPIYGLSKWLDFFSSDTGDLVCGLQQYDMGVFLRAVGVGTITVTGANKPCLLPPRIPYYNTLIPALTVNVT
jgi:hypothetical protein